MYTKKSLFLTIFLSSVIVAAVFVGSWAWTNLTADQTNELNSVEIREYKGERLGSINDFRENSIKGPQYIDNTSYRLILTGLVANETAYTYDEVVSNHTVYEKVVTIHCVEGWEVTILWEGVLVEDLLKETGYDQTAEVVIYILRSRWVFHKFATLIHNRQQHIDCPQDERCDPSTIPRVSIPTCSRKQVWIQVDKMDNGDRGVKRW